MKIIEKQGKTIVRMSHQEWLRIGQAFEVKKANNLKQIKYASKKHPGKYLPLDELMSRLKKLGFDVRQTVSGHSVLAIFARPYPLRQISINAGIKAYEENDGWDIVRQDIKRQDNDLLTFLYEPKFKIPSNLDPKTLKLKESQYEHKKIPFASMSPALFDDNSPYEILINNQWHNKIEDIDYTTNTVMTETGDLYQVPSLTSLVTLRKEIA